MILLLCFLAQRCSDARLVVSGSGSGSCSGCGSGSVVHFMLHKSCPAQQRSLNELGAQNEVNWEKGAAAAGEHRYQNGNQLITGWGPAKESYMVNKQIV